METHQLSTNSSDASCVCCDDAFGPTIAQCRDNFDFTLLFEQSILSLAPSLLLLLIVPFRCLQLSRQQYKVKPHALRVAKIVTSFIYGALQLALLILWSRTTIEKTRVSIPSAVFGFIDALVLGFLSRAEHSRSVRPSTLICVYLFFSAVFDAVQCRTLWLLQYHALASVLTAIVASKLLMLLFEAQEKRQLLRTAWQNLGPESTSGIFSRSFFFWLNDMMAKGFQGTLSMNALHKTDEQLKSELLLEKLQTARSKHSGRRSLLLSLIDALKQSFFLGVFPRICLSGFKFAQPFLVTRIIEYVQETNRSKNTGYGLIAATGIIYLGYAISTGFYQHKLYRSITMIRGALVSIICVETLRLDTTADASAPLTLTSTDVERICGAFENIHELWATPLEIGLALWLLERQLGVGCVVPAVVILCCAVASKRLSGYMGPSRKAWNEAIQRRVSTTSKIIGMMKEVKFLGLQEYWLHVIQALRVTELDRSKSFRMFIVFMNVIGNIPSLLGPTATFGVFVLVSTYSTGRPLSLATAFTATTIINLLAGPISLLLFAVPAFSSAMGCFERIEEFLNSKQVGEKSPSAHGNSQEIELASMENVNPSVVEIAHASLAGNGEDSMFLEYVNLKIFRGTLNIVTGKVGSGKTTLLKIILGETSVTSGSIKRAYGSAAYCEQATWLVNGTIRQNILGQSEFDATWYDTVINACCLNQDLGQLLKGDETLIGSNAVSLSGGQKQRVSLARAIYSRKPVLIVDDILSGLDWATQNAIWKRVFGPVGLLRKQRATVILATHFVNHLQDAESIIMIDSAKVVQEKPEALRKDSSLQPLLAEASQIPELADQIESQKDDQKPSKNAKVDENQTERDDLKASGDLSIYSYYFKSIGWGCGILILLAAACEVFFHTFLTVWLRFWTQAEDANPGSRTGFYYGIYAMLSLLAVLAVAVNVWVMFVVTVPKSAANLHLSLLRTVMSAPLSFFVATDTGSLVNRFSQDMTLVDQVLPSGLYTTIGGVLSCIAEGVLIILGSRYLAAVIPFILVFLYGLQSFYLRTSRQIRLLDLEAKSPLYTHILETAGGLSTIRAFGWESSFSERGLALLDDSQRPYYLLYCIQRWLSLVLDVSVAALAVILVSLAMFTGSSAGALAVALVSVLSFNSLLGNLVTSWTSLETSLGAITRLRTFEKDTPAERSEVLRPTNWPSHGQISINDITASYSSKIALDKVSLDIKPAQKVAICGRTGSGKSSLLLTLFRLLELDSGSIELDGIDVSNIALAYLRQNILVIPQEPAMFPGTLRSNITIVLPQASDDQIVTALRKVELWDVISPYGLGAEFSDVPLSQGQKQLFCLARAVLQKDSSSVLVLDEAMSSVDHYTEELMVKVIASEFVNHTVLSVAHRLNTIMDFDTVAILDNGRIVEVGNPKILVETESRFQELWRENGSRGEHSE